MEHYTTKKKEAQVSCFVTAEDYERVKKMAEAEGRSISNFARQRILKEVEAV